MLQDINKQAEAFIKDKDTFINKLAKSFESSNISSSMKLQKELDEKQKRYNDIDNLFIKVYDDYAKNILNEDKFNLISQNYEKEQKILKQQIQKLNQEVEKISKNEKNIEDFTQIIEKCLGIKELTGTIVSLLIDKIIISDKQVIDGELTQKIKIIYRFVGNI